MIRQIIIFFFLFCHSGCLISGWGWWNTASTTDTKVKQKGTSQSAPNGIVINIENKLEGGNASAGAATAASAQQPLILPSMPEVKEAFGWINEHRRRVIFISFLALYVWAHYRLWGGRLLMQKKSAWCNWQDPLTAENIAQLSPEVLSKVLVDAIVAHYDLQSTSFVSNMGTFFNATDEELQLLRAFVDTASTLQAMHLSWFFGLNQTVVDQAQGRIRKLIFMRRLVSKQLDQIKRAIGPVRKTH